jgi:exosortase A
MAPGDNARWLRWGLLSALVALGSVYWSTFHTIYEKWGTDAAYSHGYLLVPISIWLAWRKRHEIAAIAWQPAWTGLLALGLATGVWVVARGSGVLVLQQAAAVAMIPAVVLSVAGWQMTRALAMPFLFLFFAVPAGRGIVPLLMQQSADFATWALQATGIPVYRSHMRLDIPGGSFEVAKACSGLNFFITGIVIGTLYGYLTYAGWKKRLLCIVAFIVVPLVANGVRIYLTILVSHLTDMRYGPGQEHVWAGRIFFVAVMLVMFYIGRRWADEPRAVNLTQRSRRQVIASRPLANGILLALLFPAILAGPLAFQSSVARSAARLADASILLSLPATDGWQGPDDAANRWRPRYTGALAERQALYRTPTGGEVDVFVAVYGLGVTQGSEMITYRNVLSEREIDSLPDARTEWIELPSGTRLPLRETRVRVADDLERLVWHWYLVGDRATSSQFSVKAFEAVAFLTGRRDTERIVALSTPLDPGSRDRLRAFLVDHAACAAAGFAPEACGG